METARAASLPTSPPAESAASEMKDSPPDLHTPNVDAVVDALELAATPSASPPRAFRESHEVTSTATAATASTDLLDGDADTDKDDNDSADTDVDVDSADGMPTSDAIDLPCSDVDAQTGAVPKQESATATALNTSAMNSTENSLQKSDHTSLDEDVSDFSQLPSFSPENRLESTETLEPGTYVTVFDYVPTKPNELAVVLGDLVHVFITFHDGWCLAESYRTRQAGLVPLYFLVKLAPELEQELVGRLRVSNALLSTPRPVEAELPTSGSRSTSLSTPSSAAHSVQTHGLFSQDYPHMGSPVDGLMSRDGSLDYSFASDDPNPISDSSHAEACTMNLCDLKRFNIEYIPHSLEIRGWQMRRHARLPNTTLFFVWRHRGEKIFVSGTFNNWQRQVPMFYDPSNRIYSAFAEAENLVHGDVCEYKFFVDGVWVCDDEYPVVIDDSGHKNNFLVVCTHYAYGKKAEYAWPSLQSVSDVVEQRSEPLHPLTASSDDMSWTQEILASFDGNKIRYEIDRVYRAHRLLAECDASVVPSDTVSNVGDTFKDDVIQYTQKPIIGTRSIPTSSRIQDGARILHTLKINQSDDVARGFSAGSLPISEYDLASKAKCKADSAVFMDHSDNGAKETPRRTAHVTLRLQSSPTVALEREDAIHEMMQQHVMHRQPQKRVMSHLWEWACERYAVLLCLPMVWIPTAFLMVIVVFWPLLQMVFLIHSVILFIFGLPPRMVHGIMMRVAGIVSMMVHMAFSEEDLGVIGELCSRMVFDVAFLAYWYLICMASIVIVRQ